MMTADSFTEKLDKQNKRSQDNSFGEFRREKSQGTDDSSSFNSSTSTYDYITWESKEDTISAKSTSNDPLVPSCLAETSLDREMLLSKPTETNMFTTNDASVDNTVLTTTDATLDTKSDEETFDLLVQLYESWK
jgi:hypothetical protein